VATLGEPVVGTAVYGPVRTVVWEDGGREAPSYPIVLVTALWFLGRQLVVSK